MTDFQFWYAYYDSLFLRQSPTLPSPLFKSEHSKQKPNDAWPTNSCPSLAKCFQLLQIFLQSQENWIPSRCTSEELSGIEKHLNILLNFLQLQKKYAIQFWQRDSRRVEASITHFYCFIQVLIKSIIPYPTMTIFECKAANKLCIQISKLQVFMNSILNQINRLANFLSGPQFEEERALAINFFENLIVFMKKLPNIKRNRLNHIPQLTKYVILNNPIEISYFRKIFDDGSKKRRKKSNTIGTIEEICFKSDSSPTSISRTLRMFNGQSYLIKRASASCEPISKKWEMEEDDLQCPLHFVFSERVRQHSENTKISKNKPFIKMKSRTSRFTEAALKLSKTASEDKNKSNTMTKKETVALSRIPSQFSAKSSSPTKFSTISTRRRQQSSAITYFEHEEERFDVVKREDFDSLQLKKINWKQKEEESKKVQESMLKTDKYSKFDIETGNKFGRGWRFVRDYFWTRVQERKLGKIFVLL